MPNVSPALDLPAFALAAMNLSNFFAFLAFAPPPSQSGTQPNPTGQMVQMLGMMLIMGFMFYFVLIRPQQKKAKEHAALLKTVRNGDTVVTSSGIVGTVVNVKEDVISIRSSDSKLEILKSAVSEIKDRAAGKSDDK